MTIEIDPRKIPAWILVAVVLIAVLVGLSWVSRMQALPGSILLQNPIVASMDSASDATKTVALPHVWDNEKPAWQGRARYSFAMPREALERAAQGTVQALYLPRVGARFRVLLGTMVIAQAHWDAPAQDYVDTSVVPHLIEIPPALVASSPALHIEVHGQLLRKSGLSAPILGDLSVLQPRYERVMFWQLQITWMVAATSLLVALLCALMWQHNREKVFGLLAAASFAWAMRLALTPLVDPPMPFELWFYLHKLSFTLYCGFLYLFLWEVFDFRQTFARRLVVALLWVGPVWLAVTTWSGNYNLYRLWTGVITLISVITLLVMFARARWGLDSNQRLMVVVGVATMITGVRDFAVVQLGFPGDGDMRWMTAGSLVFMLTLVWIMVKRTAGYMQHIGDMNVQLEARVAQKESELRLAFDSLREAERRQVLVGERARLTRDMHDGLGSQLVQTLNLVRSQSAGVQLDTQQLQSMLSFALEELRMTLDSLEPLEGDLPAILGTLRQRITPALDAAGIELDWQVQEVPTVLIHGQLMDSRAVMHVFRALQEIFTNIIKHAHARQVTVRTAHLGATVLLSVTDDGVGLGAGERDGGRGMDNLRARSLALGADLQIHSGFQGRGTSVELHFPMATNQ